jgi:uncharacterized integral membrane protein
VNTENKSSKPSLREELRQWFRAAPRVWLIVGIVIILAIIIRGVTGALAMTLLFWALILGVLFVLPAIIGAVAGSTIRDVIRWVRSRRSRKEMRKYVKRLA